MRVEAILSEGEQRVIALAGSLADTSGSGQPTPFVFDDPISSLDQDVEEHVFQRLVHQAQERQVIIFTHRLSLVAQVELGVKKSHDVAKLAKQPCSLEFNTASLRRQGKTEDCSLTSTSERLAPTRPLNRIRDGSLKQLRKLYESAEVAAYGVPAALGTYWQLRT